MKFKNNSLQRKLEENRMKKMSRGLILTFSLLICSETLVLAGVDSAQQIHTKLHDKSFSLKFLSQLQKEVELLESENFDEFFKGLNVDRLNETLRQELRHAQEDNNLIPKIVFMKQYLDFVRDDEPAYETLLSNVHFSEKLHRKLIDLEIKTAQDLRHHRMYKICAQFRSKTKSVERKRFARSQGERDAGKPSRPVSLKGFGEDVYGRVKADGAELINEYLTELRKLLEEVVEDKEAIHRKTSQLNKVLVEIDTIVNTTDFYEKRQKLYQYLQESLANDYEQFSGSAYAQDDLAKILTRLKSRGLDLMLTFLFSNFEFLEDLFKIWAEALTAYESLDQENDSSLKLISDVMTLYRQFKQDSQNSEKYTAYMEKTSEIFREGPKDGDAAHLFELLHNASLNIGTVTMNMIRSKCDEF